MMLTTNFQPYSTIAATGEYGDISYNRGSTSYKILFSVNFMPQAFKNGKPVDITSLPVTIHNAILKQAALYEWVKLK